MAEQSRLERQSEQAAQWARNRAYLQRLWQSAQPLTEDCPAGVYLASRGLKVPQSEALRYMMSLEYWDETGRVGAFPALLAAVTSPKGEMVALHRTYLTRTGRKAPVPTVKKLTRAAGSMAGSSIKIGAPVPRPDGRLAIGVAEGIETALAASLLSGIPVWSCVCANGLKTFETPDAVQNLYVFGDRDANGVGQRAAGELATRAARAGVLARVLFPENQGDWNDDLLARMAAA